MRKPPSLTPKEAGSFMKVLYSFFLRDEKLSAKEEEVLSMLVNALQIKEDQQKEFQVMWGSNVEAMAEEVKKISDPGVRRYLLLIIRDLHEMEKTGWLYPKQEIDKFESTYNALLNALSSLGLEFVQPPPAAKMVSETQPGNSQTLSFFSAGEHIKWPPKIGPYS